MNKGLFVTFEGIDGSGKTTQVNELIRRLAKEGIPYLLYREPGGTDIGEKIRDILLDKNHSSMLPITELLLYSASRYQLTVNSILPALNKGKVVICDRFYDSTTAYQGYGRGIDLDFIHRLNCVATKSLKPDLTFILDISLEERKNRLGEKVLDRLEQENLEFHKRVRKGFIQMANHEPERMVLIDGNRSVIEQSKEIWNYFKNLKDKKEK
ncbi:MAG TPA: dTMP kinase [Candidatus Marinimicrobia bacterium]|nr:dTMP kinase [Candidatus Neomarinimicrobiota bacterium]